MIRSAIGRAVLSEDLTRELARAAMEQVLEGQATPAQIAALAVALRMKGETVQELAGMAEAMRRDKVRDTHRRGHRGCSPPQAMGYVLLSPASYCRLRIASMHAGRTLCQSPTTP